jgi:GNAT superfamily N-acetyltransferase
MHSNHRELILKLEKLAANIWPAPIQQPFQHWQLRAGNGVTMRANSVLTSGPHPLHSNWFAHITDFYKHLSLPVRFHISDATDTEVDSFLESNEFVIQSPSAVYQADCNEVLTHFNQQITPLQIKINDKLVDEWLNDFLRLEQHSLERKATYEQIFSLINYQICYLRLYENDELVGLGTSVLEDGWAGFGNIVTSLNHRKKGIGARIVQELAHWSSLNGAEKLYLQVMRDNKSALSLYTKLGFSHVYDYHYRADI